MFNAITEFFYSLTGVTFPAEALQILAFALASWLVGALVGVFSNETRRVWNWSVKVVIIMLAVIYSASYIGLTLSVGGV